MSIPFFWHPPTRPGGVCCQLCACSVSVDSHQWLPTGSRPWHPDRSVWECHWLQSTSLRGWFLKPSHSLACLLTSACAFDLYFSHFWMRWSYFRRDPVLRGTCSILCPFFIGFFPLFFMEILRNKICMNQLMRSLYPPTLLFYRSVFTAWNLAFHYCF